MVPARQIFTFFAELCERVGYVHSTHIIHRDLKPANIFIDQNEHPVIGDFGLCFRTSAESITESREVAAARWFGAPELRDGHNERPPEVSDVYSLGKLLYWLFTGKVFDGHEQDYDRADRKLVTLARKEDAPPFAWADDIVSQTVRYAPTDRSLTATEIAAMSRKIVKKIDAHAHVLDLNIAQHCMFCVEGTYRPIHLLGLRNRPGGADALPGIADRREYYHNPNSIGYRNPYLSLAEVAACVFQRCRSLIPI